MTEFDHAADCPNHVAMERLGVPVPCNCGLATIPAVPMPATHNREREHRPGFRQGEQIEWVKTLWACPRCGRREMWQEADPACDYYVECSATCKACGFVLLCVRSVVSEEDDSDCRPFVRPGGVGHRPPGPG